MTLHRDELQVSLDLLRDDMDAFVSGGDFDAAFAHAVETETPPASTVPFHGMLIAAAAAAVLAVVAGDFLPSWSLFETPAGVAPALDTDDLAAFDLADDALNLAEEDLTADEWVTLGAELEEAALAFPEGDPAAFEVWLALIRVAEITGDLEQREIAVEELTSLAESDGGLLELVDSPFLREEIEGDLWISISVDNPIGASVKVGDERIYGVDATLVLERGRLPVKIAIDDLDCGELRPEDRLHIHTEDGRIDVDDGRETVTCTSPSTEAVTRPVHVRPRVPEVPEIVRNTPVIERPVQEEPRESIVEPEVLVEEPGLVTIDPENPCGDLIALEPSALMGKLRPEHLACLHEEMSIGTQTRRDKISRLLLIDAWSRGDMKVWQELAENHLHQFATDAELAYIYAHYLGRQGQYADAMYWAEKGLSQRRQWVGQRHVKRVDRLMRLKAICAYQTWIGVSKEHAIAPSKASQEKLWKTRGDAKVISREWLDHARESGLDTGEAMGLCASAAATHDYCE